METYFKIRYEFDREKVHDIIDQVLSKGESGYICVADGNIMANVNRNESYSKVIDSALFSVCDSGIVPVYLNWLYGIKRDQYRGADLMRNEILRKKYRMAFLGTDDETLNGLKLKLTEWNSEIPSMTFASLPFMKVEDFDYDGIAKIVDDSGGQIVWIALGAPKQEIFMNYLLPKLKKPHVMIGVGAAFNFYGNSSIESAPNWVIKYKIESIYRIFQEPRKQLGKMKLYIRELPSIMYKEIKQIKQKSFK